MEDNSKAIMEFTEGLPIHRQVSDYCCACILEGRWGSGERIPSTKDLALQLSVNHRTVMRAYETLAEQGIIFQRRGMGYYVCADAVERIAAERRRYFVEVTVPRFRAAMTAVGLSAEDVLPLLL